MVGETVYVTFRQLLLAVLVPLGGMAAGCSAISAAAPVVIAGTAIPCTGGPTVDSPRDVEAEVFRDGHLFAHRTSIGTHDFEFSVPPGSYTVTSNQSYATPVHVSVVSGKTVAVRVLSDCS